MSNTNLLVCLGELTAEADTPGDWRLGGMGGTDERSAAKAAAAAAAASALSAVARVGGLVRWMELRRVLVGVA